MDSQTGTIYSTPQGLTNGLTDRDSIYSTPQGLTNGLTDRN